MTELITLHKLVKRSIKHKLPCKTFNLYYSQLEKSFPIEENEYVTNLLTLADPRLLNQYKTNEYQINIVLNHALSSPNHLKWFFQNLTKVSEEYEILYLTKMNKLVNDKLENEILKALVILFREYALNVIENSSLKLCNHVVLFCINLIDQHIPDIQELIFHLLKSLKKYDNLEQLLQEKSRDLTLNHFDNKVVQKEYHAFKKLTLSKDKMDSLTVIKKYLWLNKMMKEWNFHDKLLTNFVNNFISGNDEEGNSRCKNPFIIAQEFISSLLSGYENALHNKEDFYVIFNWKNYILTKLPLIISDMKFNDQEYEKLIHAIISENESTIHQLFVKSCIQHKIPMFQKLYPTINEVAFSHDSFHQDVMQKFNEKLLTVNSEFISLEESGFIEFMSSLSSSIEFLNHKQVELSAIFNKVLDELISGKDFEKLNRLLLTVLNNGDILKFLVFNNGPYDILYKLIDFIDRESFDLDDDDEIFSDFYSYFGVILLGILMILEVFQIDLKNLMIKDSFALGYINDFYYRLCDNFVNDNENEEKSNIPITNLLNDWINSLFDDANDGLSDDLIKSINIKQIYKLIPIVYKQSIIAGKLGVIDFPILINGIDYLSQLFLIPCSLSIINWLLKEIRNEENGNEKESETSKPSQFLINVLHEIIKSNINEQNEVSLIFKIVLNICGRDLLHTLRKMGGNETVKEINEIVTKTLHGGTIDKPSSNLDQLKSLSVSPLNCSSFLLNFLETNPSKLVQYLLNEAVHEDKILSNLLIYLMILNSTNSNDEKVYWYEKFSTKPSIGTKPECSYEENVFSLSANYHFSSLFGNDTNPESDKDFMIDDDLFNDNPKSSPTSNKLDTFRSQFNRNEGSLRKFEKIRVWEYFNELGSDYKFIQGLNDCVVEELARLSI